MRCSKQARQLGLPHLLGAPGAVLAAVLIAALASPVAAQVVSEPPSIGPAACDGWVYADVVAIDQPIYYNRLGAFAPQGKLYALSHDVISTPQGYRLRPDKRPRPLVLRVNEGECLRIKFTNRLSDPRPAGIHVVGMQWVTGPLDDGSYVGGNPSSLVTPGNSTTYYLYAEAEGTFLLYNAGTMVGGEADGGTISDGLFGAVNVEPRGSEWFRSQVTKEVMDKVIKGWKTGPDGKSYPVIDYYAADAGGKPFLRMRDGSDNLVYSDLTAIITGPGGGPFTNYLPSTHVYPNRQEPFREFTIIFHDEIDVVQAFPQFNDQILSHTLHSVRDSFAINYGTGGIGAEILANRLEVGPMWDCPECKYEEFFLSAWAVGDPAMIVDTPANAPCDSQDILDNGLNCTPKKGPKATVALYPDDPSNVYHSYLNDHVKFRNLHAGTDDHHIFHLHAHQWLHTPKEDTSSYLDSQSIGQGTSFSYEIAYEGSGNRNRTAGDSIFHCHFYPHFAQGMWAMWRVHDVLELGTELNALGQPVNHRNADNQVVVDTTRALPDGEIAAGTPIPGVVPMPTLAMAPVPDAVRLVDGDVDFNFPGALSGNPGYPFWIPGKAGHRPPHPPLDFAKDSLGNPIDGGLPRHVVLDGAALSEETRLSFEKVIDTMAVQYLSEAGEPEEVVAMNFHAQPGGHPTLTPEGLPATFEVNGAPPQQGAPYADPCIDDAGNPITDMRYYKAADIQVNAILNKSGWHFPQQRMIALWGDVRPTLDGTRPPEPFFFRAESGECIEFWLANLVPHEYHLDDYQVRTPTDILGQHIHLVKFDVTSSDGSANGFNYEDGTFAPEEVQERICAIRRQNGCEPTLYDAEGFPLPCTFQGPATATCPLPETHPTLKEIFGEIDADCDGHSEVFGVQATVQRWWVDPLLTTQYKDRTLHTVFTHDHFGPSTHQQAGLYAGLVVEPKGSQWFHNETGQPLSVNGGPALTQDGGPTSWQAVIDGVAADETYREFMLEFGDFQLAYEPGSPACPDLSPDGLGYADPPRAINPPGRRTPEDVGLPWLYLKPKVCPTSTADQDGPLAVPVALPLPPCPEAISADDPGMFSVNYRNEPVALRVRDPATNSQAAGLAGDLSWAYSSIVDRADDDYDVQPLFYPPLTADLAPGDPFTPVLRAYEGDRVHVRVLVGAHEEEHNFSAHGLKWLFEPDYRNSGFRNSQHMGISQWFDMEIPRVLSLSDGEHADFLYKPSSATEAQWNGTWGLLRLYRGLRTDLVALNDINPAGRVADPEEESKYQTVDTKDPDLGGAFIPRSPTDSAPTLKINCPAGANIVKFDITAVAAAEALQDDPGPTGDLVYNSKTLPVGPESGPLHDPTAIMFVYSSDLNWVTPPGSLVPRPRLKQNVKREPLILRARAGDCIRVVLHNELPSWYADLDGYNAMPMIVERFNANEVDPSFEVGLHPQLVHYDIRRSDGANVGLNQQAVAKNTVLPGESIVYHWFAGEVKASNNAISFRPIEFGATGLVSSDPIKHTNKGAVGALIIEPVGATWQEDWETVTDAFGERLVKTRATATVSLPDGTSFRELVAIWQNDVNLRYRDGDPVHSLLVNEDPTESGQKAINYRTEPLWFRTGHLPESDPGAFANFDFSDVLSSTVHGDPETPILTAKVGTPVRFRFVHPGGHTQAHVPEIFGHLWQKEPYLAGSTVIGDNPNSEVEGARHGHGPTNHFDAVLLHGAGGALQKAGDYLYKDYPPWLLDNGMWGILRVVP